ncbi:phospholipase A1 1-like [Nymphalis io]|uniref:phospholipase A1 1-like n=1 Tax=Inachis io TaxID=171585 RepID=UPI00216A02C4|nr:phospholipase A1 1-like [Nymphalis io]
MRAFIPFLLSSFLMYVNADNKNDTDVVDFFRRGIQKEIQTVKQPIDETIAYVGSSQCKHVKKLLGVSYEQLQGESEPDLNSLTLHYKTRAYTTIINITAAAESLRQARSYDPDEKLIIFVHGFTDDPTKDSFTHIHRSFIENGHIGLIALDGSSLIRWIYLRATTYVQFMGQKLGEILAGMVYQGQDPTKIHIIGHSLGAHISGFAGKAFYNLTGKLVGRISGLDPAGPCFSHVDPDSRLMHTDAAFVDVMHTDAGVYGIKDAVGHADYFPNSGTLQPNCLLQTCSHSRAWQMYGESVLTREAFPAIKCSDWEEFKNGSCKNEISYMGYGAKSDARGKYFLQTNGESPYGMGVRGIKYTNTDGIVKSISNVFG